MSSLSSNWARLKSTITPKSSRSKGLKLKKDILKSDTKQIQNKKIKAKTTSTDNETLVLIQGEKTAKLEKTDDVAPMTFIGATLWSNESEIATTNNSIDDITNGIRINQMDSKKKLPGKYLAIDCEFVGVGPEGAENALARVSIVNFYGYVVYDKYVRPTEKVTDWRTWVSGITPKHMKEAITFKQAQSEAAKILAGKVLVGHAVSHDLESLFLSHPKSMIRDTTRYQPFRAIAKGKTPGLKKLTQHFLKIEIQDGEHSSVEDARATMLLFRMHRKDFEKSLKFK